MAFKEDTLGESSVLLSILNQMEGIVFEIVHHSNLVYAEVLVSGLNNGFLEVAVESQDLSVVFQPLGGNLWDGIVLVCWACGDSSELACGSRAHGGE
jgi:hypothetical protein